MTLRSSFLALLIAAACASAAPTVSVLSPSDGSAVSVFTTLSVTFNEPVTGVDANDLSINSESALGVSGSGAGPYVFTFTQPPAGAVGVSWEPDHGITGIGTGEFAPPGGYAFTLADTIAPTVGKIRTSQTSDGTLDDVTPTPGSVVVQLSRTDVTFSELVTGVDAADLLVGGVPATAVTGGGAGPYVFTFPIQPAGTINLSWAGGHGIADGAGNAFAGGGWSVTTNVVASFRIREFLAANGTGIADENGEQTGWIEIHNSGVGASSLLGWSLSDDGSNPRKWVFPSRTLAAGAYLVVFASGKDRKPVSGNLHTNFKIGVAGGYLGLFPAQAGVGASSQYPYDYDPTGAFGVVITSYPPQRYDYSYAHPTSGPGAYYHTPPTPGAANGASTLTAIAATPTASVSRGFFKDPFTVVLTCATAGATVRYTLDGTVPTAASTAYTTPIAVSATTILRAVAFAANYVPSEAVTHSYIFLDGIFAQPSPPYDNPANPTDDANPDPPSVGGVALPVHWGTAGSFQNTAPASNGYVPFNNLPATNSVPADYGMDTKIVNDPNLYNDAGVIAAGGKTNLDRMKTALRELPIVSVVLPSGDMWGPTAGALYPTSTSADKTDRTKPCSLEMLLPDGSTAFAVTCGIDLHGNASRDPFKNPKHGFTLKFKGDYGAGVLDYPVFTDSPVEKHDKLVLRADFNFSWRHQEGASQRIYGNRVRDAWSKDTFRAMGRPCGHHRYVNLFINGIYWGSYDLAEDHGDNFGADYFGGDKADYDVMEQGILKNGTQTAYNTMTAIAVPIDNTKYEQMKTLLDVPNYIDYMLLHFFVGHTDWGDNVNKNWYAVRNWKTNGTYKFLPWDMENLLAGETVDRTAVTAPAGGLHPKLVGNAQYLLDFADRVHRHMISPDGALLPAANIARLNKWMGIMNPGQQALESARWGDYRMNVHNYNTGPYNVVYTWNGKWWTGATQTSTTNALAEQTRLNNTYFPARTNNVMGQLRTRTLYPLVNAPEIRNNATNIAIASQTVPAGFVVKFANVTSLPAGTSNAASFYYTTNGTDPRVYYTGAIAAGATAVAPNATLTINATTTLKVRAFNGTTWSALNEQTFFVGTGTVIPPVRITEIMYNPGGADEAREFIELRNTGTQPVDISNWFLGGVECIIPFGTVLGPGDHFLLASNDNPAVFAAMYPGAVVGAFFGGELNNGGERVSLHDVTGRTIVSVDYQDSPPWPIAADNGGPSLEIINADGDPDEPSNWKASAASGGTPGTANSTPPAPAAVINEFLVKNGGAYTTGGFTPGYVELHNPGPTPFDMANRSLNIPPALYVFPPGTSIPAGGYLVVHFGVNGAPGHSVATPMPREGGSVVLYFNNSAVNDSIRYGPQATNFAFGRVGGAWVLTTPTPGAANIAAPTAAQSNLRLNEWLANPRPGFDDWIELYNTHATQPVVLGGLYTGAGNALFQYKGLAAVAPLGWGRMYCNEGTNSADALDFNIPATGATLTLRDSTGTQFDSQTYAAQSEDVSRGRLPDGTATIAALVPSPGVPNHIALTGVPQLNEILAININGDNAPWGRRPGWIEIRNPTGGALSLAGWKLRAFDGSAEWTFPSGVSIAGGAHLTVWADNLVPISTTAGPHMNSALNLPQDQRVELLNASGQLADSVAFGKQLYDQTIGRTGGGTWALLASPTRNSTNAAAGALGPVSALRINEWSTSGVEIFNTNALPVALGGLYLSDDPSEVGRRKFVFAPLSYIAGSGFASYSPVDLNFEINWQGEYLRLAQSDDTQLDAQSFGYLGGYLYSMGRLPDGTGAVAPLWHTQSMANAAQGTGPVINFLAGPSVVTAGTYVSIFANAINAAAYQWNFNGAPIPGASGAYATPSTLYYNFPAAASQNDGIYTVTFTGPGGSVTSGPIPLTVLHTYDTWIASFGNAGAPPEGDLDFDGVTNLAEFIANTDPTVGATPAERAAAHTVGGVEFLAGVPTNLTLDFRLHRRAAFTGLGAEISPDLSAWSPTAPTLTELLSTEPNGDQHWRMKFSIPGGASKRFIRLGITE